MASARIAVGMVTCAVVALLSGCKDDSSGRSLPASWSNKRSGTQPGPSMREHAPTPSSWHGAVTYPHIEPRAGLGNTTVRLSVQFEFHALSGDIVIDRGIIEGARASQHHATYPEGLMPPDLEAKMQLAFVDDVIQDAVYEAVLSVTRKWRGDLQLDSDTYLELLAALVQQIPYDEHATMSRFPVEVLADQKGDCDEKSRLLAGLLSREGYAVALLSFSDQKHMTAGIRAEGIEHGECGFAILESTSPTLPGQRFVERKSLRLDSQPEVVRVGNGERAYCSGPDLVFAEQAMKELKSRLDSSSQEIERARSALRDFERQIDEISLEIERLRTVDITAANAAIGRHNAIVEQQRNAAKSCNDVVALHNKLAAAINEANEHSDSRRLLVQRLREALR